MQKYMLLVLALVGCVDDPPTAVDESRTPSVSGSIELATGTPTDGYGWLMIELDYSDEVEPLRRSQPIPTEWPELFQIGNNYGQRGEAGDYRLRAWLTTADVVESDPPPGAPHTEMIVHASCMWNGWCDPLRDIQLVLAN